MINRINSNTLLLSTLCALALGSPTESQAQQHRSNESTEWAFSVGAGLLSSPNYTGDNERQLMIVPALRATYGKQWAISFREGVQYTIYPTSSWSTGAALVPFMGRSSDGDRPFQISGEDTDDLLGLAESKTTFALKLFTQYKMDSWSFSADIVQSIGNDARAKYSIKARRSGLIKTKGPPLIVSGGLNLSAGNRPTLQSLVGVTSTQSIASGLQAYRPNAGVISYGVNGTVILPLTRSMSLLSIISIDQLAPELADSSLVTDRGDSVQSTFGFFINYRLGVKAGIARRLQ